LLVSPLSFIGRRIKTAGYFVYQRTIALAFIHPNFRKVAAEFFLEVGVLWFVFPILDTIVQFGTSKVTAKLTLVSICVAIGCLFIAGILSRSSGREE
jgi:hypothetical protein